MNSDYVKIYKRFNEVINNEEIIPELSDNQIYNYLSRINWMPIPNINELETNKTDITTSPRPHISFRIIDNNCFIDIFFNGKESVNNFLTILESESYKQRKDFIDSIRSLNDNYSCSILYCEKPNFASTPDWIIEYKIKCNELNEKSVFEFIEKIKEISIKRDNQQKLLDSGAIATIAVKVASTHFDINDNNQLTEVILQISNIFNICLNLKTVKEILKIRKPVKLKNNLFSEELDRDFDEEDD